MNGSIKTWRLVVVFAFVAAMVWTSAAFAVDETRRKSAARAANLQAGGQPSGLRTRQDTRIAPPQPHSRWTLGVRVDSLETGTRITHVEPASAAWRFGLEVRDEIVSINGFQIGYVNRRLYDISRELNLRADSRGWVRLLVWNHRNSRLVNVDVALDRQGAPTPMPRPRRRGIQGAVAFQTSVATNQKAVVVVQLLDITDRLKTPKQIAVQEIPYRGQTPVEFLLDVDPSSLTTGRRYELKAKLMIDGRAVMASLPGSYMLSRTSRNAVEMLMKPIRFDKRRRP